MDSQELGGIVRSLPFDCRKPNTARIENDRVSFSSPRILFITFAMTFSTLESVDPNSPSEVGPFDPVLPFEGDIADTEALEKWVVAVAVPAAMRGA
jgi:hypothetical protein